MDEHVFNNGEARPAECIFRSSDIVLLGYWARQVRTFNIGRDASPVKSRRKKRGESSATAATAKIFEIPKRD